MRGNSGRRAEEDSNESRVQETRRGMTPTMRPPAYDQSHWRGRESGGVTASTTACPIAGGDDAAGVVEVGVKLGSGSGVSGGARGGTSKQMCSTPGEDYTIDRRYFVCFDPNFPLVRRGQMEAAAIPGTMSHYCFAAISIPGAIQIRKYSCYCASCSRNKAEECIFTGVVRTDRPDFLPRQSDIRSSARTMSTGWVEYSMKFRDDIDLRETRSVSKEARAAFEKELRAGSVVGVYCGGEGEVGHLHFWLAVCKSKGKTASSKVTYKALDEDPGWDIKKGVTVLNVRWLERTDEDNDQRLWRHGTDQTLSLDSILPYRITWEATSGGKIP
jgi:hypothetical protein